MTCHNLAFQLQIRIVYEVKMCKNMQGEKDEYQLLVGLVQLHRIDSDVLSKLFFNGSASLLITFSPRKRAFFPRLAQHI